LDTLSRSIEENTIKIGDTLIQEEEKLDEARKKKKEAKEA
jgi:hypothetical protein